MTTPIRWAAKHLDKPIYAWILAGIAGLILVEGMTAFDWRGYDLGQLVALGPAILAVAVGAMTYKKEMIRLFQLVAAAAAALFVVDVFVENGSRFPGVHLGWLWLVLVIFALVMWFAVAMDWDPQTTPEEARLFYEPPACRLRMPVTCAMIIFGVGTLVVFRSWTGIEVVAFFEILLAVVLAELYKIAPREPAGRSVTT